MKISDALARSSGLPESERLTLREYPICAKCGEYRYLALRRRKHTVLCANCRHVYHTAGYCLLCGRSPIPIESHHVAGRKYSEYQKPVCLNCHRVLTQRQKHHSSDEEAQVSKGIRLLQGHLDMLHVAMVESDEAGRRLSAEVNGLMVWLYAGGDDMSPEERGRLWCDYRQHANVCGIEAAGLVQLEEVGPGVVRRVPHD